MERTVLLECEISMHIITAEYILGLISDWLHIFNNDFILVYKI